MVGCSIALVAHASGRRISGFVAGNGITSGSELAIFWLGKLTLAPRRGRGVQKANVCFLEGVGRSKTQTFAICQALEGPKTQTFALFRRIFALREQTFALFQCRGAVGKLTFAFLEGRTLGES